MTDKIKSDGGSSSYYEIRIPTNCVKMQADGSILIEAKDIIRYALGNDFSKGNVFKALMRLGQKEGTDVEYDRKKMHFFIDDICDSETANKSVPKYDRHLEDDTEKGADGHMSWIVGPYVTGMPSCLDRLDYIKVWTRGGSEHLGFAGDFGDDAWVQKDRPFEIVKFKVLSKRSV